MPDAVLTPVCPYKVVTDGRKSRQGAYIESVGTYNPIADKDGSKVKSGVFDRPP